MVISVEKIAIYMIISHESWAIKIDMLLDDWRTK